MTHAQNDTLRDDIIQYGRETFVLDILGEYADEQTARLAEKALTDSVAEHDKYNKCSGGGGCFGHFEETKEKLRGPMPHEQREKISESLTGEKNPFFGKKHTEETKDKLRGKAHMRTGYKHSPETKAKMCASRLCVLAKQKLNSSSND